MKLLQIKSDTNRRRLPAYDIFAPVREAAAISGAAAEIEKSAKGIWQIYDERRTKAQVDENNLEFQLEMNKFTRYHADKEYYSADELPADIEVRKMDTVVDEYGNVTEVTRDRIPAYEVYPQLYKKKVDALINGLTPNISNQRARRTWRQDKIATADNMLTDVTLSSVKKQREQIAEREKLNFEEALAAKNYNLARELNAQSSAPEWLKQQRRDRINIVQETDSYDMFMARDNVEAMVASIEFLKADDDVYYQNGGVLDQADRLTYINAMEREIATIGSANQAAADAHEKLIVDEIKRTTTQLNNNKFISPDRITYLRSQLNPLDYPKVARNFALAVASQPKRAAFSRLNIAQREKYLKQHKRIMSTTFEAEEYDRMLKHHEYLENLQYTDTMRLGIETGTIRPEEFVPLDFRNLSESLESRIPLLERLVNKYGYVSGILTEGEANELAGRINDAPTTPAKMAIAAEIRNGLGDRAGVVFEQLRKGGLTGTFVSAAQAASDGYLGDAQILYEGDALLKADPSIIKNVKTELTDYWIDNIGMAYADDFERREDAKDAFYAAYARIAEPGEFRVDKAKAERAMNIATGGIIHYNNNWIEPPSRYFGEAKWENYVENLHYTGLAEMGEPMGMTTKQLKTAIDNGRVQFLSVGKNKYRLVLNGQPIKDSTGNLFTFYHDPDLMTKQTWDKMEEAERRAEEQRREEERRKKIRSQAKIYEDAWGLRVIDKIKSMSADELFTWFHGREMKKEPE